MPTEWPTREKRARFKRHFQNTVIFWGTIVCDSQRPFHTTCVRKARARRPALCRRCILNKNSSVACYPSKLRIEQMLKSISLVLSHPLPTSG